MQGEHLDKTKQSQDRLEKTNTKLDKTKTTPKPEQTDIWKLFANQTHARTPMALTKTLAILEALVNSH